MIARYSRPEMAGIWSEEYKFSRMLDVEVLAVEAQHKLGRVPKRSLDKIKRLAAFDVRRINEREKITHHDVVAFIDEVCSHIGTEARYFHLGLTSSDILDTALSLQMRRAADIILGGVRRLARLMLSQAKKYKYTACIGRTHGVHAEPLSFGLKLLSWFSELRRQEALLLQARDSISFGKLSGAVGTYSNIDPFVERYVCRRLGLRPEPVATQVIPRDRHALYLGHLAVVGRGLARFALEIRHLQRSEVLEAEEPFSCGQRGSSAMPHKRNPIICERICGLARLIQANAATALENIPLWHERDISHSSVERVTIPDTTILLDYILDKMYYVVKGMRVHPENMLKNLAATKGLIFSQRVLTMLMGKGLKRQRAYEIVQRNAMKTWSGTRDFLYNLSADKQLADIVDTPQLKACFNLKSYLGNIDKIFKRFT